MQATRREMRLAGKGRRWTVKSGQSCCIYSRSAGGGHLPACLEEIVHIGWGADRVRLRLLQDRLIIPSRKQQLGHAYSNLGQLGLRVDFVLNGDIFVRTQIYP